MSDDAMLDELLKVNAESLGTVGGNALTEITGELYPKMCENLYSTSKNTLKCQL